MLKEIDSYDWREAFGYAGEPDTEGSPDIRSAVPGDYVSCLPFARQDVAEIFHSIDGENDGPPWRMIGLLHDGRYFYLEAGCGYTGWDCQAGGSASMANTLHECIHFGATAEARELFGIAESNPSDDLPPASGGPVNRVVGGPK